MLDWASLRNRPDVQEANGLSSAGGTPEILEGKKSGISLALGGGALGIAAFLVFGATRIAKGSLDTLMDRELPHGDRKRIREIVLAHPATRDMHDLRTRNAGNTVFIELHLELDRHLTLANAHDITDEVERRLMAAFPQAEVLVHQEPYGLSDERLDTRIAEAGRIRRSL